MLPDYAMIEPTSLCNLDCISCFRRDLVQSGETLIGSLGPVQMDCIKNELPNLSHIRFHGMGELFILSNHVDLITKLRHQYPDAWIEIVTNGQFHESNPEIISTVANRITFSMSGGDEESYEIFHRGAKWGLFRANLLSFVRFSDRTSIELNFVCTPQSISSIKKAVEVAIQCSVAKMRINIYQDWSGGLESESIFTCNEIKEIKDQLQKGSGRGVKVDIVGNPYFRASSCEWMNRRILIAHDGEVLPCCMRPLRSLSIGNIFKEGIKTLWVNRKIEEYREKRSSGSLDFCKNCPYVTNARILSGLL